jgi:hypothetical protein
MNQAEEFTDHESHHGTLHDVVLGIAHHIFEFDYFPGEFGGVIEE